MTANLLPSRLLLAYVQYAGTHGYDIHLITSVDPNENPYYAAMRRADGLVQVNISARAIDRIELPSNAVLYRVSFGGDWLDVAIPYERVREVMVFDREHGRILRYPICHGFDPIEAPPVQLDLSKASPRRVSHLTVVK